MLTKNLDTRICDIYKDNDNTQTIRENIRESENEMRMAHADIDNMSEEELQDYIEELEWLWEK